MASWADVTKAKEVLGWEPQVTLKVGVKRMIEWYLENREWASHIKI
jgi:nucleoside-diphosphate-sugar epimerase